MFPPWEKLSEEETEEESRAGEGKGDGLRILEVVPQTASGQEREVAVGGGRCMSAVFYCFCIRGRLFWPWVVWAERLGGPLIISRESDVRCVKGNKSTLLYSAGRNRH